MYTGSDIQDGMDVYDCDENKIGVIADVYPNLGSYGDEQAQVSVEPGVEYFKVDQGGILGIGAKHLYIPFTAIETVNMNDGRLTINCTKQQADGMFDQKPAFLQNR